MPIQTIEIAPQESLETLPAAFATALHNALGEGWTLGEDNSVTNESGVGVIFESDNSSRTYMIIKNKYGKLTSGSSRQGNEAQWAAGRSYFLDVLVTSNSTVALDIRPKSNNQYFTTVIANDNLGCCTAFYAVYSSIYAVTDNEAGNYTLPIGAPSPTATASNFSFAKCPNVETGAMFNDLYVLISTVSGATLPNEMIINDTKYYAVGSRSTQTPSHAFAVKDG